MELLPHQGPTRKGSVGGAPRHPKLGHRNSMLRTHTVSGLTRRTSIVMMPVGTFHEGELSVDGQLLYGGAALVHELYARNGGVEELLVDGVQQVVHTTWSQLQGFRLGIIPSSVGIEVDTGLEVITGGY